MENGNELAFQNNKYYLNDRELIKKELPTEKEQIKKIEK